MTMPPIPTLERLIGRPFVGPRRATRSPSPDTTMTHSPSRPATSEALNPAASAIGDAVRDVPDLPYATTRTAVTLADTVGATMWASGKAPSGIATACLYVADVIVRRDNHIAQRDLSELTGTSHVTMRRHSQRIPIEFVDHVDADVYDALPDPIREGIELFAAAERDGNGWTTVPHDEWPEIDPDPDYAWPVTY